MNQYKIIFNLRSQPYSPEQRRLPVFIETLESAVLPFPNPILAGDEVPYTFQGRTHRETVAKVRHIFGKGYSELVINRVLSQEDKPHNFDYRPDFQTFVENEKGRLEAIVGK